MSDLLTRRLHEQTDGLPTRARGPSAVRRAAEAGRRRSRVRSATVIAVAVLVAGSWLLGGGGGDRPDVPAVTPTPTPLVTLDRFLRPSELPTGGPFASWAERRDSRDMIGLPTCTTMVKGEPVQSRLVEFPGASAGTVGYQSVAAYPSIAAATSASLGHFLALQACSARLGATVAVEASNRAGDGYQVLRRPGRPGETELTVHVRAGRLVSVVWLTAPSDALLPGPAHPSNLLGATLQRLFGRVEPAPSRTPAEDPLAAAMLQSGDVSGGSAKYDDVSVSEPERDGQLSLAHPCARPNPTSDLLLKSFTASASPDAVLALQRIMVAIDDTQAQAFERALRPLARDCGIGKVVLVHRIDGTSVSTLAYRAAVEADKPATVHVAIVRVGPVVSEIALVDRDDDGADQSRLLLPLAEKAIERIRAASPSR